MRKASIFLILLLVFSLVSWLPQTSYTQSNYWVEGEISGRNVIFWGENVSIALKSNAAQILVKISNPNNTTVYSNIHNANSSFSYSPSSEVFGKYTIHFITDSNKSETWFWMQDAKNLYPFTLPYSWTWRNIDYFLMQNCTLQASFQGKKLNIDWLSEIFTKLKPSLTLYKNDYGLIVFGTYGKDIDASSWLMDTCFGMKLRINGSLAKATTLKWNFKAFNGEIVWALNSMLLKAQTCNLVFDYSDLNLRSLGCTYTIDKTLQKLNIYLAQSFDVDPAIFTDGWESGDNSQWTSGGLSIVTSPVHHGIYAAESPATTGSWNYKNLASAYSNIFMRYYFQISDQLTNGQIYRIMRFSNTVNGTVLDLNYRCNAIGPYLQLAYVAAESITYYETLSTGEWHCLEIEFDADTDLHYFWLGGVQKLELNATSALTVNRVYVGAMYDNCNTNGYWDCVVVDTSYIGPESSAYITDLTQGLTAGSSVLIQWNALFNPAQTITGAFSAGQTWDAVTLPSQDISGSFDVGQQWNATFDPSSGWTFTFQAGPQWDALIDMSQLATFSVLVDVVQGFFYLAELTQNIGIAILADVIHVIATTGLTLYVVLAIAVLALTIAMAKRKT